MAHDYLSILDDDVPLHIESRADLVQALYNIKARNAFTNQMCGDIPDDLGRDIKEVCDVHGVDVLFVLTRKET